MDKTNKIEMHRSFLIETLPEPLTRASAHIQIFDNYIANTRIRLRSVRNPQTRNWTRILQQRIPAAEKNAAVFMIFEIYLNESEYERFNLFEGAEIRKNRYFHEYDGKMLAFDLFIGELWGLNMTRVDFENADDLRTFEPPKFLVFEVTNEPFFLGENLVLKNFNDVRAEVAKLETGLSSAK